MSIESVMPSNHLILCRPLLLLTPSPPSIRVFFFFSLFFFFLTLHKCIRFAKYQNESATGIHVFPILNPPPSLYHPSGSSQCTSPKHPVSCIEPGLVTRFIYDIIHVSMPFSQIIPPSPSLFHTPLSPSLRGSFVLLHFLP